MTDNPIRVLVVDDERPIRRFLMACLGSHYTVYEAASGVDALAATLSVRPDVILLDLGLPDLDGVEVTRRVREWSQIPIIVISVRDREEDKIAALDAGADDYLVKPFALKEMLARLRALSRRAADQPKSPILQIADLSMDTSTHRVRRDDQLIELTAKEYSVLECLMRQPEYVLTRTQIAEHVWDYDVFNQSNVVDVYIRNLRRKVDDGFGLKLIQTVRGAGYRISIYQGEI